MWWGPHTTVLIQVQRANLVWGKQKNNKHSRGERNCMAVDQQRRISLLEHPGAQFFHLEMGGWADVHLLINVTNLMHMWLLLIKLVYV